MPKIGSRPFQRKDGRWCAKYKIGIDEKSGKARYGYIYGSSCAEVDKKLTAIKSDIQKGLFIDHTFPLFYIRGNAFCNFKSFSRVFF